MYKLGASQGIRGLQLYPTRGLSLHPYVGYRCIPTWVIGLLLRGVL